VTVAIAIHFADSTRRAEVAIDYRVRGLLYVVCLQNEPLAPIKSLEKKGLLMTSRAPEVIISSKISKGSGYKLQIGDLGWFQK